MLEAFFAASLAVSLLGLPVVAGAANPARAQGRVVWTNDTVAALHGSVSFFTVSASQPAEAESAPAYVKEFDPEWYRARLAPLREELDELAAHSARLRAFLANPRDRAEPGLDLSRPSGGFSPENQLEQLARRRAVLEQEISEVEDQARRFAIAPGWLR